MSQVAKINERILVLTDVVEIDELLEFDGPLRRRGIFREPGAMNPIMNISF